MRWRSELGAAHRAQTFWKAFLIKISIPFFIVTNPSVGVSQVFVFNLSKDFYKQHYSSLGNGRQFDVGKPLLAELRFLQNFIVDIRKCVDIADTLSVDRRYYLLATCHANTKRQLTEQYELFDIHKVAQLFNSKLRNAGLVSNKEVQNTLNFLRRALLDLKASHFNANIAKTFSDYKKGHLAKFDAMSHIYTEFKEPRFCSPSSPHLFDCYLKDKFIHTSEGIRPYDRAVSKWTLAAAESGVPDAQLALAWGHFESNQRVSAYWSQLCIKNQKATAKQKGDCRVANAAAGALAKQVALQRDVEAAIGVFALFAGAAIVIDKVMPDLPPRQRSAVSTGQLSIPDASFQMYEMCQNQKKACFASCEDKDAGGVWDYNPPRHACRSTCYKMSCY